MFTGIIEHLGEITAIEPQKSNLIFMIKSPELKYKLGDSIAINGTCLTVIEIQKNHFKVEAIPETLKLTNLGQLKIEDKVNLEKPMKAGQTFDGHFVSGHIDFTAKVKKISADGESKRIFFEIKKGFEKFFALKGSVAVNGVSLTISGLEKDQFEVCLIPYTLEKTNLGKLHVDNSVNIEIDIIARYLERLLEHKEEESHYFFLQKRGFI